MNSYDFDNTGAEKAAAMRRYNVFQNFAKLFRFLEIFLSLCFLSWIFTRLPLALRISSEYLKQLLNFVLSPLFVFVLFNIIIITLIAKPRRFSGDGVACSDSEIELYKELMKSSGDLDRRNSMSENEPSLNSELEEIVYQDKEIISEVKSANPVALMDPVSITDSDSDSDLEFPKAYRRTQSEKFKREFSGKDNAILLRRSETETKQKIEQCLENSKESLYRDEEELSNEEFQRKIETFIAKELRFRWEESLSVVLATES